MDGLMSSLHIQVNERVYLKDPNSTSLGKKIVEGSIDLIDELGFESFTFGKLAKHIKSTEASIYRYFESKHNVLVYISLWYWAWMTYKLTFGIANIKKPEDKLKTAIKLLTEPVEKDNSFTHINEVKLNRIVIGESAKIYLNKNVDKENSEGFFIPYKELVQQIADIILEINPEYKYPHMLISTIIEGAHHQRFFAEHLPRLTDVVEGEDAVTTFYQQMAERMIQKHKIKNG